MEIDIEGLEKEFILFYSFIDNEYHMHKFIKCKSINNPIVLLDSECIFCNYWGNFILNYDKSKRTLLFLIQIWGVRILIEAMIL